jgi:hypothetical protein
MMTALQLQKQKRAIRFGGTNSPSTPPDGIQGLREFQKRVSQDRGDLFFKPANADAPESHTKAGLRKIARFARIGIGSSVLLLLSSIGWHKTDANISHWPHERVLEHNYFRPQILPQWEKLEEISQVAGKLEKTQNTELESRFGDALHVFFSRMTQLMKANPGLLDEEIANRLRESANFLPKTNTMKWGSQLISFLRMQLQKQGIELGMDSIPDYAIEQLDIKNGFLKQEAFSSLNDERLTQLAKDLKQVLKAHQDPLPGHFADAFLGAFGTGFSGISLDQFKNLEGKEDAIRLLKSYVYDDKNLAGFNLTERKALIERGTEIIGAVQLKSLDVAMMLLCYTMAAGMGGLLITQRKKMGDLIVAAVSDLPRGLAKPALVVNYGNLNNPEVKQYLEQEWKNAQEDADTIARLIREGYEKNPEIREAFKGGKKLPTPDDILMQALFDVEEKIKTPWSFKLREPEMDEVGFVQKLADHMQELYEGGDFIKLGLPKGLSTPTERDLKAAKTPVEKLHIQRKIFEHEMLKAKRSLLRANFMFSQATDALGKQDSRVSELEQELLQAEAAERTNVNRHLTEAKEERKASEYKQKQARIHLEETRDFIEGLLEKYQAELNKVSNAIADGQQVENLEVQVALKEEMENRLNDPDFKALMDEARKKVLSERAEQRVKRDTHGRF